MRIRTGMWVLAAGLAAWSPALAVGREGATNQSLRGLQAVYLSVHRTGVGPRSAGLSDDEVWGEILARLQFAGIRVLTEEKWAHAEGRPYLYVDLADTALGPRGRRTQGHVYTCSLNLMQEMRMVRAPGNVVDACTWSRGATVVVPSKDVAPMRILVDRLAAEFASAVKAANRGTPERTSLELPVEKR